jgi:hypothetical protein
LVLKVTPRNSRLLFLLSTPEYSTVDSRYPLAPGENTTNLGLTAGAGRAPQSPARIASDQSDAIRDVTGLDWTENFSDRLG